MSNTFNKLLLFTCSIFLSLFLVQFSWAEITSDAEFVTELNNLKGKFKWEENAYDFLVSSLIKVHSNIRVGAVKKLLEELDLIKKESGISVITYDMVKKAILRSETNPEHLKVLGLYEEYLEYQNKNFITPEIPSQ